MLKIRSAWYVGKVHDAACISGLCSECDHCKRECIEHFMSWLPHFWHIFVYVLPRLLQSMGLLRGMERAFSFNFRLCGGLVRYPYRKGMQLAESLIHKCNLEPSVSTSKMTTWHTMT